MAEWRKYRLSDLKELRTKLASKVMRKPSEIIDSDILLPENDHSE